MFTIEEARKIIDKDKVIGLLRSVLSKNPPLPCKIWVEDKEKEGYNYYYWANEWNDYFFLKPEKGFFEYAAEQYEVNNPIIKISFRSDDIPDYDDFTDRALLVDQLGIIDRLPYRESPEFDLPE